MFNPMLLHAAIAGALIVSNISFQHSHEVWGSTNTSAGSAVAVNSVKSIPLPVARGHVNPVANDTESQVPQAPTKSREPKKQVKVPEKAIPFKSRLAKKQPRPEAPQHYHPQTMPENQLIQPTSAGRGFADVPEAWVGRRRRGPNSAFGNQFGAYADLVVQRVTEKWQTAGLAGLHLPVVVITFDIMREGAVRTRNRTKQRQQTLDYLRPARRNGCSAIPPLPPGYSGAQPPWNCDFNYSNETKYSLTSSFLHRRFCRARQQIMRAIGKTGEKPTIAVPDFRGTGDAQKVHGRLQQHPLQRPARLRPVEDDPENAATGASSAAAVRLPARWPLPSPIGRARRPTPTTSLSATPRIQNNQIVLYGWLFDVRQANTGSAQLLGKVYLGSLDEAGSRKVAQEFAADILKQFGATSLIGTRIYFVSDRTGHKEIWSMNYDGSDQNSSPTYRSITTFPAVSPDGTRSLSPLTRCCLFRNANASQFGKTAESRTATNLHAFAGNRAQAGLL